MDENVSPTARMMSYYTYATDRLKNLVEGDDIRLLNVTTKMMENVLWKYLDLTSNVLLEDEDRMAFELADEEGLSKSDVINNHILHEQRCLEHARKSAENYSLTGDKRFLDCSEVFEASAKKHREYIQKLGCSEESCIDSERIKKVEKTLERKLDLQTEHNLAKRDFENHLREFGVGISAEDRERYVVDPAHMFYDIILKLIEKYDPTGRI